MKFRCPSCHTVTLLDAASVGFACAGCGLWLATSNDGWDDDDRPTEPAWDAWPMVGFDVETTGIDPLTDRIAIADLEGIGVLAVLESMGREPRRWTRRRSGRGGALVSEGQAQ